MGQRRNWDSYRTGIWHELPVTGPVDAARIRSSLHSWTAKQPKIQAATHYCPYFPGRLLFRLGDWQVNPQYTPAPCDGRGAFCEGRTRTCTCTCGHQHQRPS